MRTAPAIDWSRIDTVLLDMDGTLLDLRFDNWFWQELIPQRFAAANGISEAEARRHLHPRFLAKRGTLQWYCIDHWSRDLGLDIASFKRATLERIAFLPGALDFLVKLKNSDRRRILVTNAHPVTLAIKDERVGLETHFNACYSTHPFEVPKENALFWPRLQAREPFDPQRTLFVDDSIAVLDAAQRFGIGWLRAVRLPDSGQPAQDTAHHPAVDRVADLL